MRSCYNPIVLFLLASCVLAASCSRSVKQKDVFWRGELWDGMNRMVFALQDLGFEVNAVDTDKGTIVAQLKTDHAKDESEAANGAGETYRILVQFPENQDLPVRISTAQPAGQTPGSSKLQKMVLEISKRFVWYGGSQVEARDWGAPD